jgi:hypothetical protein
VDYAGESGDGRTGAPKQTPNRAAGVPECCPLLPEGTLTIAVTVVKVYLTTRQ